LIVNYTCRLVACDPSPSVIITVPILIWSDLDGLRSAAILFMYTIKWTVSTILTFLLVFGPTITSGYQASIELKQGEPVSRNLKGGEAELFRVSLISGQYLNLFIEQMGILTAVKLLDPEGGKIAETESLYGRQGPVSISIVAEKSGDYTVEVRASEKGAPAGRYELKIQELRNSQSADAPRIAAERLFEEGLSLVAARTKESLNGAVKKFEQTQQFWHDAGDTLQEARSLQRIGSAYGYLGDLKQAAKYYELALPLQEKAGDRRGFSFTLNYLGLIYARKGDLQKAIDCFNQAMPLWKAQKDRLSEADTYNRIGGVYDLSGELDKALDYYTQGLHLRQEMGSKVGEAQSFNNIGVIYDKFGESQKALEHYRRALLLFQQIGDDKKAAITLNNMGYIYTSLGDTEKALEYFQQASSIRKRTVDPEHEAATLSNIGHVFASNGDFHRALDFYNQALTIQKKIGSSLGEAYTLINIGESHLFLSERDKALEYYGQSLKLLKKFADRQGEATALDKIGQLFVSSGEAKKALEHYKQALELWRVVKDRRGEATTLYGIARAERDQGDLIEAQKRINEAIGIAESLRLKVANQELRASYLASVRDYYDLAADVLMQLHKGRPTEGYDAAALDIVERARARSLLETLKEAHAEIRQGVSPELLARERSLQQQLNDKAERQIELLKYGPNNDLNEAIDKELRSLLDQYQEVQSKIRTTSPRYAALTQPQPLGLKELQQQILDPNTLLLEYMLGNERSYLWAISANSIASFELPGRKEIDSEARRVYELLIAPNLRPKGEMEQQRMIRIAQAEADFPEAAARLSRTLLAPVASLLGEKRLLIVADGALQYVPFAALPSPSPTPALLPPSLIMGHEIVHLPSASVLALQRRELKGRKPAPNVLAVLADPVFSKNDPRMKTGSGRRTTKIDPQTVARNLERAIQEIDLSKAGFEIPRLPFSRREADAILAIATGEKVKMALDFDASRSTALSEDLSQYRIVHFATHGLLNSKNPEFSAIVLSLVDKQGQPTNGFLRLHEIYNMRLPAELVVLSACQTGLGKEIRGEGLVGLTRGFMYAGAARVMASLWKVDDAATAELMKQFYKGMLGKGQSPAEALRSAQIEMMKQQRWQAPYFWAAFVLQGEWQ
jgi:CHAT domain-containing protein/tetratricopeptide (TPR) repeat protein